MKRIIKLALARFGLERMKTREDVPLPPPAPSPFRYNQDGLASVHDCSFMADPQFVRAYARGIKAAGRDYNWHWRVFVGLWAARTASSLDGDFVECGVNHGFLSSAIMTDLDWDSTGKTFFLLDTFSGIDGRFLSQDELDLGVLESSGKHLESGFYVTGAEIVRQNFSEWSNLKIIEGAIPETLEEVGRPKVAFLHIDMNCAAPEVSAFTYFWNLLVMGGIVLFDDYAYNGHQCQKNAMDAAASNVGAHILSLPTGQGLLIKSGDVLHRVPPS